MTWPTVHDVRLNEYDAKELPGLQWAAANASTTLDHLLNLNIRAPPACQRLTGIMASIGRATRDVNILEKMMAAGMNIAYLNMSFDSRDEQLETIKMLRQAAKSFSITMDKNYPLAIAIRLSGKKIRTGRIADNYGNYIELKTDDNVKLTTDETYKERCSPYTIYVDYMYLAEQLHKGDIILLDNEMISLKVEIQTTTTVSCKITRGGLLGSYKDVFVPNVQLNMSIYSEKDKLDIQMAIHNQVDMVIASVNNASHITELRDVLGDKGKRIAIIANIQTLDGFENYDEILQATDGILITRQELGSDITPKKLIIAQKNMIVRANQVNVPVCVCAHILKSMVTKKVPLRAELLDIANCVLDGADCLVLSPETAIGMYPVETIHCMSGTCKEAESCVWTKQVFSELVDKTPIPCDQSTGLAIAAVVTAQRCLAAGIIVVTTTGKSAAIVSQYRPRCPIIAVTRYPPIARRLHMWRGIMAIIYEDAPDADWHQDVDNRINFSSKWARTRGFVRVGDPLVVISGWRQGNKQASIMRIIYAEPDF